MGTADNLFYPLIPLNKSIIATKQCGYLLNYVHKILCTGPYSSYPNP